MVRLEGVAERLVGGAHQATTAHPAVARRTEHVAGSLGLRDPCHS